MKFTVDLIESGKGISTPCAHYIDMNAKAIKYIIFVSCLISVPVFVYLILSAMFTPISQLLCSLFSMSFEMLRDGEFGLAVILWLVLGLYIFLYSRLFLWISTKITKWITSLPSGRQFWTTLACSGAILSIWFWKTEWVWSALEKGK